MSTPDEVIRQAAGKIRQDHAGPPDGFWLRLATWLESCAGTSGSGAFFQEDGTLITFWCDEPASYRAALDIARASQRPFAEGGP